MSLSTMILSRVSPATQSGSTLGDAVLSCVDRDEQPAKVMSNKAIEKNESIRFSMDFPYHILCGISVFK